MALCQSQKLCEKKKRMNKYFEKNLAALHQILEQDTSITSEARAVLEKWKQEIRPFVKQGGDAQIYIADLTDCKQALQIMLRCGFDYNIYGDGTQERTKIWFFWFDKEGRKWWHAGRLGLPHYYTGNIN